MFLFLELVMRGEDGTVINMLTSLGTVVSGIRVVER